MSSRNKITHNQGAVSGLIWKTLEQYGTHGIRFILQIILARILSPEHYGVVAIASAFIGLSNVFVQKGFAVALVRNKTLDDESTSTVFYLGETISLVLYIILFAVSKPVANYYEMEELAGLLRWMSLSLFFGAYASILNAMLRRRMFFKASFIVGIVAVGLSGVVGIAVAVAGFGVWALCAQQLAYSVLYTLLLAIAVRWRPKAVFRIDRVRELFAFGWKVLLTSLLDEVFVEYRSLVIGKVYDESMLSFYNRGKQFPHLLVYSINGSMQAVLLPVLAKKQDDKAALKSAMHKAAVGSCFLVFPILAGMAIVASSFVPLLLTEKWNPCIPFIQICCVYYAAWPLETMNQQALYAIGKSNVVLYCNIIRKAADVLVLLLTVRMGVKAIAIGASAMSILLLPVYIIPSGRLTGYSFFEQIKDMLPALIGTVIMSATVYAIGLIALPLMLKLIIQILVGVAVYLAYSFLLHLEGLDYCLLYLKRMLRAKANR